MGRRTQRAALAASVLALAMWAGTATAGGWSLPDLSAYADGPKATAAKSNKPPITKRLIPYGPDRQADMAAYSQRHYGKSESRLTKPELIVIHYAVAGTIDSIYNTFAPNRPDVEFGEKPGVCSHFAVGNRGQIVRFVPDALRCRHVVGLNHVALGIEHTGFSDGDVLGNKRMMRRSLKLTQWLRCTHDLGIKRVIGHNESLKSPFYLELDPDFKGQTHEDFPTSAMQVYRGKLRKLGPC